MKIYIGHSTTFDFKNELYTYIRKSSFNSEHQIILPHENSDEPFSSKELFQTGCDLMLAEVSWPSTGLGIELGWADACGIPIIFIYRTGSTISESLHTISQDFLEYTDPSELPEMLSDYLTKSNKSIT